MLPVSKAPSEGFTVTDFTSTMLGFLDPGTLKNFTPLTVTVGVGSSESADRPVDHEVAAGRLLDLRRRSPACRH